MTHSNGTDEATPLLKYGNNNGSHHHHQQQQHCDHRMETAVMTADASESSAHSTTTTSQQQCSMDASSRSQVSRFRTSMRQLSSRLVQFVSHHTGSIGMLGSMSIAVNSLTGPAMLNLPATFARSGIIPTIATLLFVCVLSALCSLHMANSISKVPGNAHFKKEVEFSEVFRIFWGQRWFLVTQVIFLCCITCLNISSIVDTSQVVDTFAGNWWPGGTAAVQVCITRSSCGDNSISTLRQQQQQQPDDATTMSSDISMMQWDDINSRLRLNNATNSNTTSAREEEWTSEEQELLSPASTFRWLRWDYSACTADEIEDGLCLPFATYENGILLTAGNLVTTVIFLPLALMDLKENSAWQAVGFLILLAVSVQFIVQFALAGLEPSYLTWWGDDWDDLLGVVLFNFALVIAIPAWLYEREPHVDVPTIIHGSSCIAVVLYITIGLLGAMALPNVADNMLESMMSGAQGTPMQLGASLFAFAIVGLGIPLFSVLTRLNLTGSGLCSMRTGNILAVYFPFTVSWFLNDGQAVTKLLSWGGVIFTSLVAFILPLALSLHIVQDYDYEGSVSVYGGWLKDKVSHQMSLRVLLMLAVLAIFVAILGNFVDFDG